MAAVISGRYGGWTPHPSAAPTPSPQGEGFVPGNVFAATCDANFAGYYPGWYLWARVDWDTGWVSGTFFYYAYGG